MDARVTVVFAVKTDLDPHTLGEFTVHGTIDPWAGSKPDDSAAYRFKRIVKRTSSLEVALHQAVYSVRIILEDHGLPAATMLGMTAFEEGA